MLHSWTLPASNHLLKTPRLKNHRSTHMHNKTATLEYLAALQNAPCYLNFISLNLQARIPQAQNSHFLKPVLHSSTSPAAPHPYLSSQKPKIYRHKNSHPLNPYLSSQKPKIYRHKNSHPLKPVLHSSTSLTHTLPHHNSYWSTGTQKNPLNPYLSSQKPKIHRHKEATLLTLTCHHNSYWSTGTKKLHWLHCSPLV